MDRTDDPCRSGERQQDAEPGSELLARFDVEPPAHRADQLARLERADAEAAGFRRMERLEQPGADELGAHAGARIDDLDDRMRLLDAQVEEHRRDVAARLAARLD